MAHRILIIEDDDAVRDCLRDVLCAYGHDVDVAGGVEEAQDLIFRRSYALVFTDLCLESEMDGLRIIGIVRATSPGTPVVVLSGLNSAEIEREVLAHGAEMLLRKPFEIMEMAEIAARFAVRKDLDSGFMRSAAAAPSPQEPSPKSLRCLSF